MSFGSVWLAIDHFLSQCLVFVIFCGNFFVCICINNYDFDCIDGISLMLIILNVFHIVHQNVVVFLIKMLIFVFPSQYFFSINRLIWKWFICRLDVICRFTFSYNGKFISYCDISFNIYIYFWIMEQVISSCHVTSCLWDANI